MLRPSSVFYPYPYFYSVIIIHYTLYFILHRLAVLFVFEIEDGCRSSEISCDGPHFEKKAFLNEKKYLDKPVYAKTVNGGTICT